MADDDNTKIEEWVYEGDETLALQLIKPLKKKGVADCTELNLSEPTGGQLAAMDQAMRKSDSVTAALTLIAQNSGVPLPIIKEMGARDIRKATDFLMGFFPPDQRPVSVTG